jgi:hypothetical protein
VAVSFIGGENRRKSPTCRKALTDKLVSSTPRHEQDSNFLKKINFLNKFLFSINQIIDE